MKLPTDIRRNLHNQLLSGSNRCKIIELGYWEWGTLIRDWNGPHLKSG